MPMPAPMDPGKESAPMQEPAGDDAESTAQGLFSSIQENMGKLLEMMKQSQADPMKVKKLESLMSALSSLVEAGDEKAPADEMDAGAGVAPMEAGSAKVKPAY
jgi:hypothetical protein